MLAFTTELESTTGAGQLTCHTFHNITVTVAASNFPAVNSIDQGCFSVAVDVGHFCKLATFGAKLVPLFKLFELCGARFDVPVHELFAVTQHVHMVGVVIAWGNFLKEFHWSSRILIMVCTDTTNATKNTRASKYILTALNQAPMSATIVIIPTSSLHDRCIP